jgi:serine/threonine protein kinase
VSALKSNYNRIDPDDFLFYDILGAGAFGTVIKCKKKTTGKQYAMKIVSKKRLLNNFLDVPTRVDLEARTMAALRHPFIIGMEYSFQTPAYGIMVMELAEGE